jgi:hypothetical protein
MVRYSLHAFVVSILAIGAASAIACGDDAGAKPNANDDAGGPPSGEPDAANVTVEPDAATNDAGGSGSICPNAEEPATHDFTKIFDPSDDAQAFYINGHTFVRDDGGTWHLFGTTHEEPAYLSMEKTIAHATASSLQGPWTKQASALVADDAFGETSLWTPYVLHDSGKYYMFYSGGGSDPTQTQIQLATSTDLVTWTREASPLFTDGYDARGPFVIHIGNQWVLYYTATDATDHYVVAYRTSTDLRHWGAKQIAFTDPVIDPNRRTTENPFVVARGADYYLFMGPRDGLGTTAVYHSKDALSFDPNDVVHSFVAQAAEVVQDTDGKWYASHDGWGEGGVYLTPLDWLTTSCQKLETSSYRAIVETSPRAALVELSTNGKNVLSSGFRFTGPYLGVANWGDRPAGAANSVTVSPDGKRVTLKGITFPGESSVTADWALCSNATTLDVGLTWHVTTDLPSVHEVALGLSSRLTKAHDTSDAGAAEGDNAGFGTWSLLTNNTTTLLAAYAPGSAWQEDNHWLSSKNGTIAFQTLWSFDGKDLPVGDHAAGQYRLMVSNRDDDTGAAGAVANSIASTSPSCLP